MYRRNPRADAHRISQVLAALAFPAAKWQVVMPAAPRYRRQPTPQLAGRTRPVR